MAYSRDELIKAVRELIQNIPTGAVPANTMNQLAQSAKRKLDRDRPRRITGTLAGNDGKYYDLSALAGWVRGTSYIREIQNPEPIVANDDAPWWDDRSSWSMPDLGGIEYLYIGSGVQAGKNVLIQYELPWSIDKIDGAVLTDLEARFENALEFLLAALTCTSLASKAAGVIDNEIAADFINFRSKEAEYRRMSREWMAKYEEALNLSGENPAAIVVRGNFAAAPQHGLGYVTHPANR